MVPRIFISYAREDSEIAFRLARHLRDWGCRVWIDRHSLWSGSVFSDEIARAINASDYFIVLLSPDSALSEWVKREIHMALGFHGANKRPVVIPALVSDCDIPENLSRVNHADFRNDYLYGLIQVINGVLRNWEQNSAPYPYATDQEIDRVISWFDSCSDCNSDEEISQVLRQHEIGMGMLTIMEAEIFVNRREEISLFLNMLRSGSVQRGLVFFYHENESRMGISYLLRFLAYAEWDQLIRLMGERGNTQDLAKFRRLLFRSEENAFESFYYYIDILDRTVKAIGEQHFATYLSEKTSAILYSDVIRHTAETFARQPFGHLSLNPVTAIDLPLQSPPQLLEHLNYPRVRTKITSAFLKDLARSPVHVVWLFDGPWAHLQKTNTLDWLCSILEKVGKGEVQNLWLVFGDKKPIVPLDSVANYLAFSPREIHKFTPDVIRDFLRIVLIEEATVNLLTTSIWSGTEGHPARVAYTIKQIRNKHPSYCRPELEPGNYGVLIPEWMLFQ